MIVGVLGGGQLGRMLALAGLPLGLRFRFLDPAPDAPAQEAGEHVRAEFGDHAALARFADGLAFATYEFENVPAQTVEALARLMGGRVDPAVGALRIMQDRLEEKRLFQRAGVGVPDYLDVGTPDELSAAVARLRAEDAGGDAGRGGVVLKTRRLGYDGKGQGVLRAGEEDPASIARAWKQAAGDSAAAELIAECFVTFERELSLVAVRGRAGDFAAYPLVENRHEGGILRLTIAPAPDLDPALQSAAEVQARAIMEALGYVGVLAIEFFQCRGDDGRAVLLGNEMAPRVHNSGHWTLDGAECSQFENHLRALVGWPLGSVRPRVGSVCAMINLIGRVPEEARLLAEPDVRLHLYGKSPRPGRKLGHVNITAPTHDQLRTRAERIHRLIEAR